MAWLYTHQSYQLLFFQRLFHLQQHLVQILQFGDDFGVTKTLGQFHFSILKFSCGLCKALLDTRQTCNPHDKERAGICMFFFQDLFI